MLTKAKSRSVLTSRVKIIHAGAIAQLTERRVSELKVTDPRFDSRISSASLCL